LDVTEKTVRHVPAKPINLFVERLNVHILTQMQLFRIECFSDKPQQTQDQQ
jgi:hypothetical protein